jgi:anti-sigma B factor antagonist
MSLAQEASVAPSSGPPATEPPIFRLTGRDVDGGFRELEVEGELDLAVADDLKEQIAAAHGRPVLLDLSACTFIDSTGIAAVLLTRRSGGLVAVHSPSAQVLRVLEVSGLTRNGVVFGGRREAIADLEAQARAS